MVPIKGLKKKEKAHVVALAEKYGTSNTSTINCPNDIYLVKHAIQQLELELKSLKTPKARSLRTLALEPLLVAVAPHKKLPSDILIEIFLQCIASLYTSSLTPFAYPCSPSYVLDTSNITAYTPWKLRQVCSFWRELVLGPHCRRLWSFINVTYPNSFHERYLDGQIADENTHTARWAGLLTKARLLLPSEGPVSFKFIGQSSIGPRGQNGGYTPFVTKAGVDFFLEYASRIQCLVAKHLSRDQFERLLKLSPTAFKSLEYLVVSYGGFHNAHVHQHVGLYSNSTSLRSLEISGSGRIVADLLKGPIPWKQLQSLVISQGYDSSMEANNIPLAIRPILRMLGAAQSLRKLSFAARYPISYQPYIGSTGPEITPDVVTLPHLHTLTFELELEKTDPHFLDFLRLPALAELKLLRSRKRQDIRQVVASTSAMIHRSHCRIERYTERPAFPDERQKGLLISKGRRKFEELFNLLHDVEELEITGLIFGPAEFRKLGKYSYFPRARKLRFPGEVAYQEALEVIETRLAHRTAGKYGRLDSIRFWSLTHPATREAAKEIRQKYAEKYAVVVDISPMAFPKRPH